MKKYLLTLLFCLPALVSFAQISLEEQNNLINTVKQNYSISGIEGANMYRTSKGYRVLVTVVNAKGNEDPATKARRMATEFILGAENKSLSVYESHSGTTSSKESLDQKIIESSKGRVSEMQSLCRFTGQNGEDVNAYYLVVSKTNAKKGLAGVMSMVVPGTGQFYKGSTGKGCMFLGLTVAAGAGVLVCESSRSSYRNKAIEQPKYKKEYSTKADNWETWRNVCIGAAGAVYVWNVIDAFFTKSAQRPIVTSKTSSLTLAPRASFDNVGVAMAYNF